MIFVRTFKGYEDKTRELDERVNEWVAQNNIDVITVKASLGHEPGGRSGSGDLIYTVLYKADNEAKDYSP